MGVQYQRVIGYDSIKQSIGGHIQSEEGAEIFEFHLFIYYYQVGGSIMMIDGSPPV